MNSKLLKVALIVLATVDLLLHIFLNAMTLGCQAPSPNCKLVALMKTVFYLVCLACVYAELWNGKEQLYRPYVFSLFIRLLFLSFDLLYAGSYVAFGNSFDKAVHLNSGCYCRCHCNYVDPENASSVLLRRIGLYLVEMICYVGIAALIHATIPYSRLINRRVVMVAPV